MLNNNESLAPPLSMSALPTNVLLTPDKYNDNLKRRRQEVLSQHLSVSPNFIKNKFSSQHNMSNRESVLANKQYELRKQRNIDLEFIDDDSVGHSTRSCS